MRTVCLMIYNIIFNLLAHTLKHPNHSTRKETHMYYVLPDTAWSSHHYSSIIFFPSLHVYRRPTCVCDEHVWSRIMIAVAGDMIMIAALLLHNNNLGRGGVVLWCTGHAAAVHACHHQLSRARGCTRGCCYYATSCRGGPHMIGRYHRSPRFAGPRVNRLSPTTSPDIHAFP